MADRPAADGQRFCLFHAAQGPVVRGRIVYVHPFAEEMNKSRRMAAQQARALAAAGFSVLQIDLLGCGDSSGDFANASWDAWLDDIRRAVAWLRERDDAHRAAPLWLWGLRSGCLLAAEAATGLDEASPCNLLFWQPVVSGKTALQQFLRLRSASEMMAGGGKGVMDGLRQQLAENQPVEIAGYFLAPGLAAGLGAAALNVPQNAMPGRVEWLETSTRDDAALTPVATQAIASWQQAGFQVNARIVQGPAFWQTTEIEEAPQLIGATVAALGAPA